MTVSDNGSPMMFGGDGFGGSGFIWAFLIFALLMGNGGFGFGGNGNTNALSADMQRGFDNQNTMANQREILNATNGVYHDVVATLGDKYTELARDIAGVNAGVSQAITNQCQLNGDLKLQVSEGFGQTRFDSAMSTASINAVTTAQTQKILDAISQNKIEALQGRVNQLEMQNALGNVVRYPNSTVYTAGGSPFCNCNCNGYNAYPLYA